MRQIVLFDMDGTLTEPRQKIEWSTVRAIRELSKIAEIGIVTGSDYDYLVEQCRELWYGIGSTPASRITLMPCNGTKVYKYSLDKRKWELKHSRDMRQEIEQKNYNSLLSSLMSYQIVLSCREDVPFSGTFLHFRESMLNWCPIGRKATQTEREAWKKVDAEKRLREHYLKLLRKEIATMGISVTAALGGSTSIDIYPKGWDKTYALQHFKDYTCWFVGDKCQPNGNDHLIFEAVSAHGRGYVTKSPKNTEEIIKDISEQITAAQDVDQEKES